MNVWQLWRTAPCQKGRAFQERREPIHGGFAQTSLFATILKSPPFLARRLKTFPVHE
jgi:hypothetical protein